MRIRISSGRILCGRLIGLLIGAVLAYPAAAAGQIVSQSSSNSANKKSHPSQSQSAKAARVESPSSISFHDVGARAGLTTTPHSTDERRYLVETMGGGGVGLIDCNNDGKLDIVVVNDSTIDRYLRGGDLMVTLYVQDGSSPSVHFTDQTSKAGLTTRGWGMGVAIGDYDNDGLPDLYVTGLSVTMCFITTWEGAGSRTSLRKRGLPAAVSAQAQRGPTMTVTEISISLWPATYIQIFTICRRRTLMHRDTGP